MTLYDKIIAVYSELTNEDFGMSGSIRLRNDSDGIGDYIEKWNYEQPIPEGLILGKPEVPYVFELVVEETPGATSEEIVEEPVVEETTPTTAEPVVEEVTVEE